MKLTIFGATGRTGKYLVEQALEARYQVTALVRNPAKLTVQHTNLRVIEGDVTDAGKVSDAIEDADAVISALGPVRGGPKDLMATAAKHMVAGMKQHGVKRIVYSSGAGVRAPEDVPVGMHKVISGIMRFVARDVLEDSARGIEIVQNSELDWTVVRGPMLQDAPYDGKYWVGFVGKEMGRTLARGNFAHFMLKQVEDRTWVGKMPTLSDQT